ncbi:hypothetical protein AQULUS_19070 [Aquicella lusitana]|uniref:Uncharacterized protein n=1 Tax=Aquicella lusitana TaxID=254246 RepID=A0A370GRZ8_9COXI|nr:hypothetical protein C8D86_1051 [Aquicella lusitana]VVC74142.1 hypothetical protein AQULUS_19070 [Aquicella lusitana]
MITVAGAALVLHQLPVTYYIAEGNLPCIEARVNIQRKYFECCHPERSKGSPDVQKEILCFAPLLSGEPVS